MNTKNKVAAALGACAILGAGMFAGAALFPKTVEKIVPGPVVEKVVEKQVPGPVIEKIVPGPVVEKVVEVDNGNLDMVLKELVKKDGNVEYLTDGLEDDEIGMIVDRLEYTMEWESLAYNATRERLFRELDKETVDGVKLDDDDMKSLVVKDDEITFDDIDFDGKDADVLVPFRFRQDGDKFEGVARVVIRDGEYDDFSVESVSSY